MRTKAKDFLAKGWLCLLCFLAGVFLFNSLIFKAAAAAEKNSRDKNGAQDRAGVSIEDRLISYTFKTIAKTFVSTVDINKLKEGNIKKLDKMNEEKFRARYIKAYAVMEKCTFLAVRYGINEKIDKAQAIGIIRALDKGAIYEIIDAIPDTVIAVQFRRYIYRKRQEITGKNLFERIDQVWNRVIQKSK